MDFDATFFIIKSGLNNNLLLLLNTHRLLSKKIFLNSFKKKLNKLKIEKECVTGNARRRREQTLAKE